MSRVMADGAVCMLLLGMLSACDAWALRGRVSGCASLAPLSRVCASRVAMGSKAAVSKEIVIPVPANDLGHMLASYDRYTDFWPGEYRGVKVVASHQGEFGRKAKSTVSFQHKPVMGYSMSYALDIESTPGRSVLWTLNSSSLIRENTGGWRLQDLGNGTTRVMYGCEVELAANVPSFVTSFILGKAFPRMLSTFNKSAVREWEAIQRDRRERFERPLQAAAGSINETIRLLESQTRVAADAAKSLANSTVTDFAGKVDESLRAIRTAMSRTEQISQSVDSPKLESKLDENLRVLEDAADSLKSLANSTVTELSASIDESLLALQKAADTATRSAQEVALSTASQLADMQSGTPPGSEESRRRSRPQVVAGAAWAAFANSALTVLEAVVPGDRPQEKPASKRQRLGNILGFDWNVTKSDSMQHEDRA